MKISYNWLTQFIETTETPEALSHILTDTGLEVESLEKVQAVPGGLEGLVIGHVNECFQHPNADRLRITRVTVGEGDDLQIVCGAANVAAGQKVVVAVGGTTVHPLAGEPFKITKSKIRGEVSEGMICAEDEIGIGSSHAGIIELPDDAPVGMPAKEWFKLNDDYLYEIGLTPNRADAASHLGVARDLAASLRIPVSYPDVSAFKVTAHVHPIPVVVENEAACPRYSSVVIDGVTVTDSPGWLKEKLNIIGVRPINNIVDITNYVLHELGQPLHAFDAGKIAGGKVIVKNCVEGTAFVTLDGVSRVLSADDLMICNASEPMCIAGVFGGAGSGISASTTSIFLESAYFDAVSVRKTSRRHGLKTDASFRFERGTDPEMTVFALKRAALLIIEMAGGHVSSEITDFYPVPVSHRTFALSYKNVWRLIGKEISADEIGSILLASGIGILSKDSEGLLISVPPYKVDVTREVDVIEEILRLYGYNNIGIPTQIRASLNYAPKPDAELVRSQAADLLAANGFFEILTNSLTSSAFLLDDTTAVRILNPLSNELDVMRQTLLYSGLEVIAFNQKRKSQDLKLFEFGKTYGTEGGKYVENSQLTMFLTGAQKSEHWNTKPLPQTFFNVKSIVDNLLMRFGLRDAVQAFETGDALLTYGLDYRKGEKTLVTMGAVKKQALAQADVSGEVFYASINTDLLLKLLRSKRITYREVSKYPPVRRDLSVLVDRNVKFSDLEKVARKTEKNILKEVNIFDVYEGKNLGEGKKSYAMSFTLQDDEKTLTDKQIETVMNKLIVNLEKETGAGIRK